LIALAGALGNGLPSQQLEWWRAALLVLAGGAFSTIVRLVGVLADARGPEPQLWLLPEQRLRIS